MILPAVRSSLSRQDAIQLVALLGRGDAGLRAGAQRRLDEHGIDSLLDDPRTLSALLTDPEVAVRTDLVFYVLVRQALLEGGLDDFEMADYATSLLLAFGKGRRAYRLSASGDGCYAYLVDIVAELPRASRRRAFMLRTHLGNYSLWLSGLFPDYLEARVDRRGAPPMSYYEKLGASGYHEASQSAEAKALGLVGPLRAVATHFSGVRVALNRVSDRYFWPQGTNPVNRLLREVSRGIG